MQAKVCNLSGRRAERSSQRGWLHEDRRINKEIHSKYWKGI